MLALPQWFHELATLATLALAGAWLIAQWLRVAAVRPQERGCARCEHNLLAQPQPAQPSQGKRSRRLRILS